MNNTVNTFNRAVLGLFLLNFFLPANAQGVLEEIVVTAQKREQNLQDVPVSVTAYSRDIIQQMGFQEPHDVFSQAPNVTFNDEGTIPQFNVRGIQLFDFGDGNEPPVGFYVDEIYFGTMAGQTAGLFDLERVEILRGPQGTLYGRNTTGGLVHFISRKPSEQFEASASFQYGSYDQLIFEGGVGGPISDRVRARVALKYHEDDGWQDNDFTGTDFAVTESLAGRAMLDIDVTDNFNVLFNIHGGDIDNVTQGYGMMGLLDPVTFAPCSTAAARAGNCVNAVGLPSTLDPKKANTDVSTLVEDIDTAGGYIKLTWNMGEMELVSITGYETVEKYFEEDADASTAPVTSNLSIVTGGAVPLEIPAFLALYTVDSEQVTQEVRLSGSSEKTDWVAGFFYYYDDKDQLDFNNPPITAILGTVGFDNESLLESESWAVFAQGDYNLTDQWGITAGIRYTEETKDLVISDDRQNPAFTDNESLDTDKVTFKGGINWRPTEDTLVYASVARGFKSGAFKTTFATPGLAAPTAEEELTNYELGLKAEFLNGNMRLNAALFYSDYKDFQVQTVTTVNGVPGSILANAGDADIVGLELETVIAPTENLELMLGAGWIDAKVDSENPLFDNNELALAPEFSLNGLGSLTLPFDLNGGNVKLSSSFSYLDKHFITPENKDTIVQDSYVLWNARLRFASRSGQYFIEGFVDNILDEEYTIGAFSVGDFAYNAFIWGKPRWAGVRIGFDYN